MKQHLKNSESGFSLIELILVLVIISIGASVSLMYLAGARRLYNTGDQALQMIDVLQSARQYSLTKRRTMRVEFNLTQNAVRLIDENNPTIDSDDVEISRFILREPSAVKIQGRPNNVTLPPPQSAPCPDAVFIAGVHPSSPAHDTFTLRFGRNGTVLTAGVNGIGTQATVTGATIYIWEPDPANAGAAKDLSLVRAITVMGASGSVQYWEHGAANTGGVNNSGWNNNRH